MIDLPIGKALIAVEDGKSVKQGECADCFFTLLKRILKKLLDIMWGRFYFYGLWAIGKPYEILLLLREAA